MYNRAIIFDTPLTLIATASDDDGVKHLSKLVFGMYDTLRSIYHFFFLPEIRLFKHFQVVPLEYTCRRKSAQINFGDEQLHSEPASSSRTYLKTHKNDYVYICDGAVFKGHYYQTLSKRLKITLGSFRVSNLIRKRGLGEAVYHSIASTRLGQHALVRIPKILSMHSFKRLGLTYQHMLKIEYIDNARNFAEYLDSASCDYETTYQLFLKLKQFCRLMAEQGILHLDLRPENLILDPQNNLYIIDWEYACLFDTACPIAYSNFSFASFLYMWRTIQNPAPQRLDELTEMVKNVLGSDFMPDIFFAQLQQGLGRKRAHQYILNGFRVQDE